jgi:hypothetical protein
MNNSNFKENAALWSEINENFAECHVGENSAPLRKGHNCVQSFSWALSIATTLK